MNFFWIDEWCDELGHLVDEEIFDDFMDRLLWGLHIARV
jgi:hypothetical protein